jgi:hypothetical protein
MVAGTLLEMKRATRHFVNYIDDAPWNKKNMVHYRFIVILDEHEGRHDK